jgi:predicted transcriptional regulator of viral defense system
VDWAATLRKEARRSAILRSDDIARRYGIVEIAVGNALRRQERRGLVEHVSNKIYINNLAHGFSSRDLVNLLRPDAYISLESALAEWGISTQSPSSLTCVTTGFPRKFRTGSVRIIFRHISKRLYWGFKEKRTRHGAYKIAEPEKALLDWIYLKRQDGLLPALDELNLSAIDNGKLLEYASKYPKPVRESLLTVLWKSDREPSPEGHKALESKGVSQVNQVAGEK